MQTRIQTAILGKVGRGKSMLAQTVRNNIVTRKNMDLRTKAKKFSSLYQVRPKLEENSVDSILDKKISAFVKPGMSGKEEIALKELEQSSNDYEIIENPEETIVKFPIVSGIELTEKLPFFKSITCKLASIYG